MKTELICASDIPADDHSYFIPWSLAMVYAVEPSLETIRRRAFDQALLKSHKRGTSKRNGIQEAFVEAKNSAIKLIGWYARDPRLRSQAAWDFYIDGLHDALWKEFLNG